MFQLQEEWGSSLASWVLYEEGQWEPQFILMGNTLGGFFLFCFVCPVLVTCVLVTLCTRHFAVAVTKHHSQKATYGRRMRAYHGTEHG